MKRIAIIGLGYIGLPTAILAAEGGCSVFGYDIDSEKINSLHTGKSPILEPEIQPRLSHVLKNKIFNVGTSLEFADCFVITVPTPIQKNKHADISYVLTAADEISKKLMQGNLVIIESTIPVGTTEKVTKILEEKSGLKAKKDFFVAHCPERAIPGRLFKELVENDRIIGGICQHSCDLAYKFYSRFVKGILHSTTDKAAEMVKLIENSSRDAQIAFANQVGAMCEEVNLDPYHIIELANRHPRVNILSPTCGVGGHCIAIDPWFLVETFPKNTKLLQTAREVNDAKPFSVIQSVLEKVEEFNQKYNKKPNVLALGLTFKPDVDDLRESPALLITQKLSLQENLTLTVCEPNIEKTTIQSITLTKNLYEAVSQSDIIVILVKHKNFLELAEDSFSNKIVIDTCGLLFDVHKQRLSYLQQGKRTAGSFRNISP